MSNVRELLEELGLTYTTFHPRLVERELNSFDISLNEEEMSRFYLLHAQVEQ